MEDAAIQRMIGSLRSTLQERLPSGVTPPVDARIKKTVEHFATQVVQKKGVLQEQEVLRESFDSMAGWLRKNMSALGASAPLPTTVATKTQQGSTSLEELGIYTSAPEMASTLKSSAETTEEEDPLVLFERLKAARNGGGSTGIAPASAVPVAMPTRNTDLEHVDLRTQPNPKLYIQQKDYLQRQDDVIKYRENEYNLVINSKDRNWTRTNNSENRYNFSVQFNGQERAQGTGLQANVQHRFHNILRIEFVKAILPVEGLRIVVPRDGEGPIPESACYSALALPFVHILMDEYQGNNYGTNETVDRSFAICQYDATWRSDNVSVGNTTSRGYTLFFPKFMKAQKVYAPVPLSNINKLTFQLVDPENNILSTQPDTNGIQRIAFGGSITGSIYNNIISGYGGVENSEYIFIQTKEWFPLWAYSQLDKVEFGCLSFYSDLPEITAGGQHMLRWLQSDRGHIVVGTAYTPDPDFPYTVVDGANSCGYANWIIIRNLLQDPSTTGQCARLYFCDSSATEQTLATELVGDIACINGAVINLSRQVQLVLRVVTRDYDSASNVRPDNV